MRETASESEKVMLLISLAVLISFLGYSGFEKIPTPRAMTAAERIEKSVRAWVYKPENAGSGLILCGITALCCPGAVGEPGAEGPPGQVGEGAPVGEMELVEIPVNAPGRADAR